MESIELEYAAVKCRMALASLGIEFKIVQDFDEIRELYRRLDKVLSPAIDPDRLLLTKANSYFGFGFERDVPVFGFGVRIDDLGSEDAQSFLTRTLGLTFNVKVLGATSMDYTGELWGRAAYCGELKASTVKGLSRQGSRSLRLALAYSQHIAFNHFNVDTTYSILREPDRWRAIRYGFRQTKPFVWTTDRPMHPGGPAAWIALSRKSELPAILADVDPLLI